MTIQYIPKNTIRHRKYYEWFQRSGNSVKPENDTIFKILEFQDNCHKPSLLQGLEQFYNVTPCNEKCNFFILQQSISLISILPIGIIPLHRNDISPFLQNIANGKIKRSSKYVIYKITTYIMSKWMEKIFHVQTIPNQWMRRKVKDTKSIFFANSRNLNKMALNLM